MPSESRALYTLVDPISPPPKPGHLSGDLNAGAGFWWRRRVPPPGPNGLLQRAFIAIAGLLRHPEYRGFGVAVKGRRKASRYRVLCVPKNWAIAANRKPPAPTAKSQNGMPPLSRVSQAPAVAKAAPHR